MFQLNVLVVALLDSLIYNPLIPPMLLLGGMLIFIGSIVGLLVQRYYSTEPIQNRVSNFFILIPIVSALSCGFALFVDGELMRNLFSENIIRNKNIPWFIFYESITFLVPSFWILFRLKIRFRGKFSFKKIFGVYFTNPKGFVLSSFFSACQFVFTVFAFALPGARFKVVAILASAPFLCVLLDRNPRQQFILRIEKVCAVLVGIGVCIVAKN